MAAIFWIESDLPVPLAIVLCPSGGRALRDELLALKRGGIQTLVSLLQEEEAEWLDLAEEPHLARQIGLQFLSYPIPDTHIPHNRTGFQKFVIGLANRLRAGERIGVHCRGSIGRATVTAACTLIHLGWSPGAALEAIEAARGCPVPDTREQEGWILSYKAQS
jgi:protein-tyrosine phosphatase